MKPFLFCVLTSAVHCPVLVQQTVPLVDCPLVLFGEKKKS